MSRKLSLLLVLVVAVAVTRCASAADKPGRPLGSLRVLYVGNERQDEYVEFLTDHVKEVEAVSRKDFQRERADSFDVVLLDWPQGEETREMRLLTSPLGKREGWSRPTVLLGSAGLNLAVAWKMQGGSGCTCMDPVAYGPRSHVIFQAPFRIDLSQTVSIPTPESFKDALKDESINVLPLVDDTNKSWKAGWCTYSNFFDKNPDVEYFCGGINQKTPTAAGLWRQGNFLHFGFEQSPREMNERGRLVLLNSIAYISAFSQDRPIATTPSVFAGPIPRPRETPARWLKNEQYREAWVMDMFEPTVKEVLEKLTSREERANWCDQNSKFFAPKDSHLLGIDEDLRTISVAFDSDEFLQRCMSDLASADTAVQERSKRLLRRYVPCGPGQDASVTEWRNWYSTNKPYLFALDTGDFCWYIDPLAKRRGVASRELRGLARADQ